VRQGVLLAEVDDFAADGVAGGVVAAVGEHAVDEFGDRLHLCFFEAARGEGGGAQAQAYRRRQPVPSPALDGSDQPEVALSLEETVRRAVANNLDLAVARLQPAFSAERLAAAEAVFDSVFFADTAWNDGDRPQAAPSVGGIPVGTAVRQQDAATFDTGIRKPFETGAQLTLSTGFEYVNNKTPGFNLVPDPGWTANATAGLTQPLLRNAGEDVNRAEIHLSRNTLRKDVHELERRLLATTADVVEAYWRLALARDTVVIRQQLLNMTLETREKIDRRQEFDVSPVQRAQAYSFVELRRSDLIRAQRDWRDASDRLKRLLDDPSLPLTGEAGVAPADDPSEAAFKMSLLDGVTTALQHRPEVRQALIEIDDADVRQRVADNQRLPLLNFNAQVQYLGLDGSGEGAYSEIGEADFIEYVLGAQFEQPIGNRAAEAEFRAARLVKQSSVINYRSTARQVVLEVKEALRRLRTSHALIAVNRAARRAAAENLRALLEREDKGEALTPEFLLDLKLNTQQRLAEAQLLERQSVVDYNIAAGRLLQATGSLLERHGITVDAPGDR